MLTVFSVAVRAQGNIPTFEFETIEMPTGGLSNNVNQILQDSSGFLWFATSDGLFRYDGQNFTPFFHDPSNPSTISDNYVECIYLDKKGSLWVGTFGNGLNQFDPLTETFTRYLNIPADTTSLSGKNVSVIVEDRQGYIWVGTEKGLERLDKKTGKFKHFYSQPDNPSSLSCIQPWALYVDKAGVLWVGTGYFYSYNGCGGLNRYDPKTETFTRFMHDPNDPQSLANDIVRVLFEDSKGNFWVGTAGDGLQLMNRLTGKFTRLTYDPSKPEKLSRPVLRRVPNFKEVPTFVTFIFEDKKHRIWIGSNTGGFNIYDPATKRLQRYEFDPDNPEMPLTNFCWNIFQSRDGVLWMAAGEVEGKLTKIKEKESLFPFYSLDLVNQSKGVISAILKDKSDNIWMGVVGVPALFKYNRKTGEKERHEVPKDAWRKGTGEITSLLADRNGFIWAGTRVGLFKFDPIAGKFESYPNQKALTDSLQTFSINKMTQDRQGNFWLPSLGKRLFRFNPVSGKTTIFRHDPNNPKSLSDDILWTTYEDKAGNIWVGGGAYSIGADKVLFLDRYEPGTNSFRHYVKKGEEGGAATAIFEDEEGNIWFGTMHYGLRKLNPTTGKITKFNLSNRPNSKNQVWYMSPAPGGKIWLSSVDALYEFDPVTQSFFPFTARNGVGISSFLLNTGYSSPDSELFFGGFGGFYGFYPEMVDKALAAEKPPHIAITGFRLKNEPVIPGSNAILKRPIWETNEIQLSHNQNEFSFEIACMDFNDHLSNHLEYMLENYDNTWRTAVPGTEVAFVKIPSGNYTFRVRGTNAKGVWNREGTTIRIIVHPPWWKAWWAYLLYGSVLVGIYYAVRKSERKRARNRLEQERQKMEATAMRRQAEEMRQLDEAKSRFFANVSHELRTPLTLILGPINSLLKREETGGEEKKLLQYTQRSALRLQKLVNEILDLAKLEDNKMEVVEEPVRFYDFIKEQMSQFQSAAVSNGLDFELNFAADKSLQILLDKGKFEKIVHNFFSNALKFTPQNGNISLTVEETDTQLHISVSDSGRGIHPNDLPHVFDRFYQSGQPDAPTEGGTGIGLSLVKELAELLGGEVWATSEWKQGSVFHFKFPRREAFGLGNGEFKMENETSLPTFSIIENGAIDNSQQIPTPHAYTILIVEDNHDLREYLQFLLSDYHILTAENGQAALDILNGEQRMEKSKIHASNGELSDTPSFSILNSQFSIDLIISDLMMPVMDGFQFLEKVKSDDRWRHLPFIMLTAKVNTAAKLNALRIGVDDYLTKPFQEEELKARIQNLLHNYWERMEMFSQRDESQRQEWQHEEAATQPNEPTRPVIAAVDAEWLREVEAVYSKYLADSRLNVDFAAGKLHLSERQFNRRIKQLTGLTPNQYLQETRLQRAKDMLVEGRFASVKEVGYAVGFQDIRYFSELFEKHFGAKPSEMRK